MLTKADLNAIEKIINPLKTGISSLKTDVSGLKSDGSGLKVGQDNLEIGITGLKKGLGDLGVEMNERFDGVVDMIQEALGSAGEISERHVKGLRHDLEPRIEKLEKMHQGPSLA